MPLNAETVVRIAHATQMYPYRLWGYGEAIAMDALLEAAVVTGRDEFRLFAARCLDQSQPA